MHSWKQPEYDAPSFSEPGSPKKTASKKRSPIFAADLFAGAGGLSKAAANVGIQVRVAVELDEHACRTYQHNLIKDQKHPVLIEGDIAKIPLSQISSPFDGAKCDLVLGGPPCQGFSVHRIKGSGVGDPRNKLIHRYFDTVEHLSPLVFLLENVPGILWERHAQYLELFYEMAQRTGYEIYEPVVLDSRDFGVPQRRKRVFILGVAGHLPDVDNWPPKPTHGDEVSCCKDKTLSPWVASQLAFAPAPEGDVNDVHMKHSEELVRAFANTPHNGGSRKESGRLLKCHIKHDGHKDVYGRIDSRSPAPTMTTACINPSKGRFVHPLRDHGITVRQAARIQTFPDDFTFLGGIMAAGRQIGNAVPVGMGEAVLRPILNFLEQHA